MVITKYLPLETKGNTDVIDITCECKKAVVASGLKGGVVTVFHPGSTGALTTIEFEPNLVKDLKDSLEVFAPTGKVYNHAKTWKDDNGGAHIRSSLIGPSLAVPFVKGELLLGTWQQIVFCDFDTRPRSRTLVLQIMGD
jgi:secondary thiamine-phosphate synthase enzyme